MDIKSALSLFDTLSQETRLKAFRLLVKAGPQGLPAGALSKSLQIPHNTLSFHLAHLANAGLVTSRKDGRSVIYAADYDQMRKLIEFMVADCCSGEQASIKTDHRSGTSVIRLKACCD